MARREGERALSPPARARALTICSFTVLPSTTTVRYLCGPHTHARAPRQGHDVTRGRGRAGRAARGGVGCGKGAAPAAGGGAAWRACHAVLPPERLPPSHRHANPAQVCPPPPPAQCISSDVARGLVAGDARATRDDSGTDPTHGSTTVTPPGRARTKSTPMVLMYDSWKVSSCTRARGRSTTQPPYYSHAHDRGGRAGEGRCNDSTVRGRGSRGEGVGGRRLHPERTANRSSRELFPTPESPMMTSLKR